MQLYDIRRQSRTISLRKGSAGNTVPVNRVNRREFLRQSALTVPATAAVMTQLGQLQAADFTKRSMTIDLVCGNLGIAAAQTEAVALAARHGFESVGADASYLASVSQAGLAELKDLMKGSGLVFGAAGLPVEFRQDEQKFAESLKKLPDIAAGLQRAGVNRIATWLTPCDAQLTYLKNFRRHVTRLRPIAKLLKDYNLRLGLEYVSPKTSWTSRRYPFIHTMGEMKDLIAEIDINNVGLVLDSWHWWNAGDSAEDILALKGSEVIAVDLNDAPAGIPKDHQLDNHRELPCATGVIDLGAFLNALNKIGYNGPVRAEPFNQAVNKMSKDEACQAAAAALRTAFAKII